MLRYQRAQYTQSIYKISPPDPNANSVRRTTRDGGFIDRMPRTANELKYQVPGGMEGLAGWRSDLYKFVPESPEIFVGSISVRQSSTYNPFLRRYVEGGTQNEFGFRRRYPDGTYFVDVLSNTQGEVFEARVREKQNGQWESYVAYKNVKARPDGYHGLKQSCASCHADTGTGNYGAALVAGGDTVISDPFPELER